MSENRNTINWYPGHMEKAKRQMLERLKAVDMVIEVRDARIPDASTNPMLLSMVQNKPRVIILSKCDMADPVVTQQWIEKLNSESVLAIALDLMHDPKSGKKLVQACLKIMQPKREKQIARGIRPRAIRAMAAGIPNVRIILVFFFKCAHCFCSCNLFFQTFLLFFQLFFFPLIHA